VAIAPYSKKVASGHADLAGRGAGEYWFSPGEQETLAVAEKMVGELLARAKRQPTEEQCIANLLDRVELARGKRR